MLAAAWVVVLFAQSLPGNPVAEAARGIGRGGLKESPPPASSPGAFKSDGTRRVVAACAKQVGEDEAQRKAFEEIFLKLIDSYEKIAKQVGKEGDATGALAFSIAVLYAGAKDLELDDNAFLALIDRFQATLDVPAVRGATDAQKQEFYEASLCAAGTVLGLAAAAETAEAKAGLRKLARAQIDALIGADLDRLTLKGKEITLKVSGAVEGFTFTAPAGWIVEGGWHYLRKADAPGTGTAFRTAAIRFLPTIEPTSDMGATLRELWKQAVPPELAERHSTMVYRRYVGDGLFAQFVSGKGREKGRKADSLFSFYLIDLGVRWQPMVVAQTYEDPDSSETIVSMMAGFSYNETAGFTETFLATLRCPSAKGLPLVSKEALVGAYSYGNSSNLQWENIYTGASSMTVVSYGGTLDLKEDGRFTYTFQGASGQVGALRFATDKDNGTWEVQGDLIVLTGMNGRERKHRVAGLTLFQDGVKVAVLFSRLDIAVNATTGGDRSEWYSTKKK